MVADGATSLRRGLAVLVALSDDAGSGGGGVGVVRLAELLGQDKSQVSRTLKTLAGWGLVDRDPATRAYRLGWRLYSLAARAGDPRLIEAAPGHLERLVADLNETAHLSVLHGTDVLTVLSRSPARAIQAAGWVGHAVPVHCTSAGRALLLDHDPADVDALFAHTPLEQRGPNAPQTVAELAERVAADRRRGYALVEEEFEEGLVGAGAPVRDFAGRIVAALNVSAPAFRFANRLEDAGAAVRAAAERLSAETGQRGGARS